jgi:DNA-directed RNA polymerase subunit RPC12/RpoP
MASSYKPIAPETPPLSAPASLSADSSTIAKEAVALEAGRSKTLKRSHADAMGSPGTPVDPYLQSMGSSPKLARLDAQQQDPAAAAADAVAALLDGNRLKDDQMHPGLGDATGYRVLTELSADNMASNNEGESPLQHEAHEAHDAHDAHEAHEAHNAHDVHQSEEHQEEHDEDHEQHQHHEHHEHDEHDPQHHQVHDSSDSHAYHDPQGHHEGHDTASSHGANDGMGMGGVPVTESPTPMEVDARIDPAMGPSESFHDDKSGVSMSYPGAFQSMDGSLPPTPTRGMTYPEGAMSSGVKKYKCSDCNTEFTRHHNLKSHQLTHSQEKPFKCDDCDMRFRRLHDLKRHSKLHTGEKPHICTKCNRKFARGDALVRHTKGVMGCSTARNSLGGHEDGEIDGPSMMDGDDTAISGIMYGTDGEVGDEDQRRLSLPALKTQPTVAQGAHGRTYPQSNSRGSIGPFTASPGAHAGNGNFAPTASMTDSPKPMTNGGQRSQPNQRSGSKHHPNVPIFGPGDARYQSPNNMNGISNSTAIMAQMQEMVAAEVKKFEDKLNTIEQAHRAQIAAQNTQIASQNTEIRTQYAQIQVLEHELSLVKAQYAAKEASSQN